jgi:hypothetical protein
MASPPLDRLYDLLPAIYRIRDADRGGPLRAFLEVVAEQVAAIDEDLDQLYDDQFIETCADWVVPYIGDLIGYRPLHGVAPRVSTPRAEVANTIAYRRHKGTAAALEQLARDVTGWPARVVEYFELLATTQFLNRTRPENLQCPDLRRVGRLLRLGTPLETATHDLDIRSIAKNRGRYNIPNVGIFLWRLDAYPLTQATAFRVSDGAYAFNPLGIDAPLFNPGRTPEDFAHLAEPSEVPEPLPQRPLSCELEALRQALAEGAVPPVPMYFGSPPVFSVSVAVGPADPFPTVIPPEEVLICDLSLWRRPDPQKVYQPRRQPGAAAAGPPVSLPIAVAVDPVLGRLTFPAGAPAAAAEVRVDFRYGFPADLGGGAYTRADVTADATVARGGDVQAALAAAAGQGDFTVEIGTSATYDFLAGLTIAPDAGQRLTLRASAGTRPTLVGSMTVNASKGAQVTLDGLLIGGDVTVNGSDAMTLVLRDCTLPPWLTLSGGKPAPLARPSVTWADGGDCLLTLERCVTGRLALGGGVRADVSDSIVDALYDTAAAFGPPAPGPGADPPGVLNVARSTMIGTAAFREIGLAEDSVFTGALSSVRRQSGCVRFCYVSDGSQTPRRFRCQPETAAREAIAAALKADPYLSLAAQGKIDAEVRTRVRPSFTVRTYGQPAYCQLLSSCPPEITAGASDETELGAYARLYQSRRVANLRMRLGEYLRFGLEAGIFTVT